MAYKPIDTRRDEFRKYLERTGVLDMFTKVLSKLMTETDKPEDAIEFIRANLGDSLNEQDTIETLHLKLNEANQLIDELREKLSQYEPKEISEAAAILPSEPTADLSKVQTQPMQVDVIPDEGEITSPVVAAAEALTECAVEVEKSSTDEGGEKQATDTTVTPMETEVIEEKNLPEAQGTPTATEAVPVIPAEAETKPSENLIEEVSKSVPDPMAPSEENKNTQ